MSTAAATSTGELNARIRHVCRSVYDVSHACINMLYVLHVRRNVYDDERRAILKRARSLTHDSANDSMRAPKGARSLTHDMSTPSMRVAYRNAPSFGASGERPTRSARVNTCVASVRTCVSRCWVWCNGVTTRVFLLFACVKGWCDWEVRDGVTIRFSPVPSRRRLGMHHPHPGDELSPPPPPSAFARVYTCFSRVFTCCTRITRGARDVARDFARVFTCVASLSPGSSCLGMKCVGGGDTIRSALFRTPRPLVLTHAAFLYQPARKHACASSHLLTRVGDGARWVGDHRVDNEVKL